MDALGIAPRGAGRLRLGRPRRLRRGGAVARARALPGELHRLQHPEHRRLGRAGAGRAGASLLVPVLFPHRARPRRPHQEPPRHLPAAVEAVVAGMALRRGDLREERRLVRQSRFRRGRDPVLSPSLRLRARRSGARGHRGRACRGSRRSPCRPSTCMAATTASGRCRSSDGQRAILHRPLRAARAAADRPQRAAGGAGRNGRRAARPHERNQPSEQHRPDRRHRKHRQPHPRRGAFAQAHRHGHHARSAQGHGAGRHGDPRRQHDRRARAGRRS